MTVAYDHDAMRAYLATTDEELKLYVDEAHMSYLPIYLGRADALHALGVGQDEPERVLLELQKATKAYRDNGPVLLAKWPPEQFRRRRLEPLEVALLAGDGELAKGTAKVFGIDPMTLFAGIEPDAVSSEIHELTPYFKTEKVEDVADLAGALAVFYWLSLASIAGEDGEGYMAARRRASRLYDDMGHLAGGVPSGGVARIRTVQETLGHLRPARPELVATGVLRHQAFSRAEHTKAALNDPHCAARGLGSLDRTALALLAIAGALGVDCGAALAAQGADASTLAYARRLGHGASQ